MVFGGGVKEAVSVVTVCAGSSFLQDLQEEKKVTAVKRTRAAENRISLFCIRRKYIRLRKVLKLFLHRVVRDVYFGKFIAYNAVSHLFVKPNGFFSRIAEY